MASKQEEVKWSDSKEKSSSSFYFFFSFAALLISFLVYLYLNNYFTELVLVSTSYGPIQGYTGISREGRKFYQFNAIPYAKPPVGQLRFHAPVPVEPWESVQDGTRMTPVCAQYDMTVKSFRGQEDCLFVNVFTPYNPAEPATRKKLLPVMVFFHGGLFMCGGSWEFYGGRYFMDEDVVLVTVSYRLGVLGFLNTGDGRIEGNLGLKDQLESLKFVRRIISEFGGDPNLITIFGESAGGASVHYHMLSPQSKGFFQHAISQSGSSFSPWAFQRRPREQAIRFAAQVGCLKTKNNEEGQLSEELVNCLRSLTVWELIKPHKSLLNIFIDPLDLYGPSVENITGSSFQEEEDSSAFSTSKYSSSNEITKKRSPPFLPDYPYKLAANGKTHPVPWLSGINSHEGCFKSSWFVGHQHLLEKLSKDWDELAGDAFLLFQNDTETLSALREYHFGKKEKITEGDYEMLTNLVGDHLFAIPVRDAALLHAHKHGRNASVYLYFYSHKGDFSFGDFLAAFDESRNMPWLLQIVWQLANSIFRTKMGLEKFDHGACHVDELFQLMSLNPISILDINPGHQDFKFSRNMIKTWVNFARDGKPGKFDGVTWEKLQGANDNYAINAQTIPNYLHLNGKRSEMIKEPFHPTRLSFWQQLKLPRNLDPIMESVYEHDVLSTFQKKLKNSETEQEQGEKNQKE